MKRLFAIILVLAAVTPAIARIVVERRDGSFATPESLSIVGDADNHYTIGGIPVEDIFRVFNNPIQQPQPGEIVEIGQDLVKPVAVLDMAKRNGVAENSEDGRYLYSAEYMMQVAGVPYFATASLDEALAGSSMLLLSGNVLKKSFTDQEYDQIQAWVESGGILLAPAIEFNSEGKCLDLFGLESVDPKLKTHTTIRWTDDPRPEFAYIDTDEERDTFIGINYIFTSIYHPSNQTEVLATYDETADAAVIKRQIGDGCVYSIGVRWRDVIQRNQLNKGGNNRVKNNHFDASADVFPLFVRSCYVANNPLTVWKHTIPNGYETVLIPTHDCDSRTAYDEMHWIAEYEQSVGLSAHFFLTVHYFRQNGYLSAFYNEETQPKARALIDMGHTVGSHSVCHFPDFSTTDRFPMTVTTPEEYAATCTFDVENKVATGGSTWAEVVMSKQIIERDLGNHVHSFRSGHLCVNGHMPEAFVEGGYSFASCYTATDLRCSFPFFQRLGVKWTGDLTDVLQMPLHYSDVRPTGVNMTEEEIPGTMPVWMDMHVKLKANYAPNILLIHPNTKWKMEAEKRFVELLDANTVGLYNFEAFGNFWVKRLALDYDYAMSDSQIVIRVNADDLTPYRGQGLFVETQTPFDRIVVTDNAGRAHPVRLVKVATNRYIAVL